MPSHYLIIVVEVKATGPPHFLIIVVDVKATGPPHILKVWLGVGKVGMLPVKYFHSDKALFVSVEFRCLKVEVTLCFGDNTRFKTTVSVCLCQ